MSTDPFYDLYMRSIAAYNRGDLQEFFYLYSPKYAHHNPNRPDIQTRDQYKEFHKEFQAKFPDIQVTLEEAISQESLESGSVIYRNRANGMGKGTWRGMPVNGKTVDFQCFLAHHFVNGEVVEGWELNDTFSIAKQIGMIPTPASSTQTTTAPTKT